MTHLLFFSVCLFNVINWYYVHCSFLFVFCAFVSLSKTFFYFCLKLNKEAFYRKSYNMHNMYFSFRLTFYFLVFVVNGLFTLLIDITFNCRLLFIFCINLSVLLFSYFINILWSSICLFLSLFANYFAPMDSLSLFFLFKRH